MVVVRSVGIVVVRFQYCKSLVKATNCIIVLIVVTAAPRWGTSRSSTRYCILGEGGVNVLHPATVYLVHDIYILFASLKVLPVSITQVILGESTTRVYHPGDTR